MSQRRSPKEQPPTASVIVDTPAPRSHKRKAASDPGEFALPPLLLHQQATFSSHGWTLLESSRRARSIAQSWHSLATSDELRLWEQKRTKYWQHDAGLSLTCSLLEEQRVRLLSSSESLARNLLASLHVDATVAALRCDAVKLLRSKPGEGQQDVHFDVTTYAIALQCYVVLLYLNDTESTAVPKRH
jgi:hypothetical protein